MKSYFVQIKELEEKDYRDVVVNALMEDKFYADVTSQAIFSFGEKGKAEIIARQEGILCGLPIASYVFYTVNPYLHFQSNKKEGDKIKAGEVIAQIEGELLSLLAGERVALNFLSFLSGIASKSYRIVEKLKPLGIKLLDTRKTIPSLRVISKYAVAMGGGWNHRFHLAAMGLIKDNHLKKISHLGYAIEKFRQIYPTIPLEVEVETMDELKKVLPYKPDLILLDNMSFELLAQCSQEIRAFNRAHGTNILIEASGGFSEENVHLLEGTGVDFVSMGRLTNEVLSLDFSMEIVS